jgi:hypothetical protein
LIENESTAARLLSNVQSLQIDGGGNTVLDELLNDGSLWEYASGSWSELDKAVKAFVAASDATLYDLEASGQLWQHANGVWTLLDSGVQQIGVTSDNTLVDLESNGELWIHNSAGWTMKASGVSSFTIENGATVMVTYANNNTPQSFTGG